MVVLTIRATEVAVAEEDIAGSVRAYQRRLLAEMRSVRRNDWKPTGVAGSNLIVKAVVKTISRTDCTTSQQSFERFDTPD